MAQIASEDYVNLLIYLHVDTTTQGFDPRLMQQEHRERRRLEANGERGFDPMVTFSGNESKGGGRFTATLVKLRAGVRIVPFDVPHTLDVLNEIVNIPDGISDRDVFDRSGVASNVDIDPTYSPVEVRLVSTGSISDVPDVKQAWNRSLSPSALEGLIILEIAGVFSAAPAGSTLDVVILTADGTPAAQMLGLAVNTAGFFRFTQAYTPSPGVNLVSFATINIAGGSPIESVTPISFPAF